MGTGSRKQEGGGRKINIMDGWLQGKCREMGTGSRKQEGGGRKEEKINMYGCRECREMAKEAGMSKKVERNREKGGEESCIDSLGAYQSLEPCCSNYMYMGSP